MDQKAEAELEFWSNYSSHLCEHDKQTYSAKLMGLDFASYYYDLDGRSVLEIGAGPLGLSLRCVNGRRRIIEPLDYPDWVWQRYEYFGVECERCMVEAMEERDWDEVYVLNVLQHVENLPEALARIRASARFLRIFEWLNVPPDESHPQTLDRDMLDQAFGIKGAVTTIMRKYMYQAQAYYGYYDLATGDTLPVVPNMKFWGGNTERAMIHYLKDKYGTSELTMAEIGVLSGVNAKFICDVLNIKQLYLIDPYMQYDTDVYSQEQLTRAREEARERLAPYSDKITWLPVRSLDALSILDSMHVRLDAVYYDGEHTYDATYANLDSYYPVTGIAIGGHDYIPDARQESYEYGVMSAVQDWTQRHNVEYYASEFPFSDWWIDKKECA